ncbi:glucose-1-phosphate thymidylyltransferase RfbA [Anaeromicrobium sediminis]|uniref:Glucose-1-phosphate thymidylyltransferase n=1 Tax=Anaeromicrobium sediminis TaxID=1478221 RepID=A0A267MMA3_9FIRM|nr:glucose-1-phosphate thymidylyltransferase RfbA [Anaeromicrobium sediminis]PAB60038.1 glucose-1-phosphate thymidylyltransferase [Anaeromicrobium sediminis]
MKGIILAGGHGTRLYPITKAISKQILPVYDKPMIYYPLSVLLLTKIREILIISTPRDLPLFKDLLGDGSQLGVSFTYLSQDEPRGIGDVFLIGKDFIGKDTVCLVLGDNIFHGRGFSSLLKDLANITEGAHIFGYQVDNPKDYGIVNLNDEGQVLSIEEKPSHPTSNFAIPGLYFYDNNVINIAKSIKPSSRGELEISHINNIYLRNNKLNINFLSRGFMWFDMGTNESLLQGSNFVYTVQKRQRLYVGCIEEIAYKNGYINRQQLHNLANAMINTEYGKYLLKL